MRSNKLGSYLLERMKVYEADEKQRIVELGWMLQELRRKRNLRPLSLQECSEKEILKLKFWISCRAKGKPLQYCLGNQPFMDLEIKLRQPVLIPRWETEEWTENLVNEIKKEIGNSNSPKRILELCTGTGCVSLALAKHLPTSKIGKIFQTAIYRESSDAIDISKHSILLAKLNQKRLKIGCSDSRLSFHQADLFNDQDLKKFGNYNLVVSNPPYIPLKEYNQLDPSVKDFEDEGALLTRDDEGIEFYQRISQSKWLFSKGSKLVFEIGAQQGKLVTKILKDLDFNNVTVTKDSAGRDRVVTASIS